MSLKLSDIAVKNIRRRLFRSAAIVLAVMVVAATLFSITTVMGSVETSLQRSSHRLGADVMVVPREAESSARTALLSGEPTTFYMDKSVEDKVRAVKGVRRAASQLYLQTSQYKCCDVGDIFIIGFDPENDFTIMPWLTNELKRPLGEKEAVMGRALTAYVIGSDVKAYGETFKIAGMLEETGLHFIDISLYIPLKSFEKMTEYSDSGETKILEKLKGKISIVLVQADPDISPQRAAIFIEYDVPGVKAIVSEQVISSVRKQLFILLRSVLSVSVILWVMALLMIAVVFSMIVNERQRELGILRALGARRRDVFGLILREASMLSLAGAVLGVLTGGIFLFAFKDYIKSALNIPYMWPTSTQFAALVIVCLALSFLSGTAAALIPAVKSMRMEPYAAIRRGE